MQWLALLLFKCKCTHQLCIINLNIQSSVHAEVSYVPPPTQTALQLVIGFCTSTCFDIKFHLSVEQPQRRKAGLEACSRGNARCGANCAVDVFLVSITSFIPDWHVYLVRRSQRRNPVLQYPRRKMFWPWPSISLWHSSPVQAPHLRVFFIYLAFLGLFSIMLQKRVFSSAGLHWLLMTE